MKYKFLIFTITILIIAIPVALVFFSVRNRSKVTSKAPGNSQSTTDFSSPANQEFTNTTSTQTERSEPKTLKAQDISGVVDGFQFSSKIPSNWQAEAVTAIESINLYNPNAAGDNNLEKSQIFIRHFKANAFLTLQTVNILERHELIINSRPAVRYVIEKKNGVANFASQPSWRNMKHMVTDIRVSDDNPSIFYVIAKRPDLSQAVYDQFLENLAVVTKQSSLVPPVNQFKDRITKKSFGTLIDPKTSPVQPERFSGYHTGVDIEYEDVSEEVPVVAIADGTVVLSITASGYGGVVVIRQAINGLEKLVLYGHLDPKSLVKNGSEVKSGERIAILGKGSTSETDGERKHLHLGILRGPTIDLRGYVSRKEELASWENPQDIIP